MSVEFKDIYKSKITVGLSRSNYVRIDMEGEGFPEKLDKMGNDIPYCISMTENQARILVSALNEALEELE